MNQIPALLAALETARRVGLSSATDEEIVIMLLHIDALRDAVQMESDRRWVEGLPKQEAQS